MGISCIIPTWIGHYNRTVGKFGYKSTHLNFQILIRTLYL